MPIESTGVESMLPSHVEREQLRQLEQALGRHNSGATLVSGSGETYAIPDVMWDILIGVVREMALGNAVTVAPATKQLTTQQAAEVLGVSRPYLIRLLEDGRIPFSKVGTHRRIQLTDVLSFRDRERARQSAARERLAGLSVEADLEI